ncbi:MAG: hypothetical protein LBB54_04395 [Cellulomonadaceae bacterium]|jgi:hypothetical protein|nr:hypothetical protein [Cellulomonadaceae bacterium]
MSRVRDIDVHSTAPVPAVTDVDVARAWFDATHPAWVTGYAADDVHEAAAPRGRRERRTWPYWLLSPVWTSATYIDGLLQRRRVDSAVIEPGRAGSTPEG